MKKIAFITTGYFPVPAVEGGAVESLVTALLEQNEKKEEYHFVVYSSWNQTAKIIANQYKYTDVFFIRTPQIVENLDRLVFFVVSKFFKKSKPLSYRYIFQRLWFSLKVGWSLRRERFNRVVLENTPSTFIPLRLFGNKKRYRGKYLYHLHNKISNDMGCRKLISQSSGIIGVSEFINEWFVEEFPDFNGKTYELKNCVTTVATTISSNVSIRNQWGIKSDDFVILYAGRLSDEKGVLELIQAFNMLELFNCKLLIVGGYYYNVPIHSDYEARLIAEAKSAESKIIFTGYVDREQLDAYYLTSDIAVFPAIWDEPAGLTVIEAMQNGVPVITTYSGGIPEYVGNNNAILLHRDSNLVSNLAASILQLYSNAQFRTQLGANGKRMASEYTTAKYYTNFEQIIEKDDVQ
ncbi:glycosyltransferase [Lactiplantibacillus plantarum]|nr:glycosyltransferase [Lactiplantibacillus plantarum]